MSFLKNMLNEHKDDIIEKIFDEELQEKIVKKLNENIDIPFISEKTEAKVLNAIYDSIEDVVDMITRIDEGAKQIDSDRWRLLRKELR